MRIVINGAGVAGPALAYWLARAGHGVLLVERAPRLRTGGYVVDFWGAGYDVADKMGIVPELHAQGYQVGEVRIVDEDGRRRGGFSTRDIARLTGGRFTSLRRSDLAATIVRALPAGVELRFDDSIAGIVDDGRQVAVTFERGPACVADLVVGADGLHSRVRELVFGPEDRFEHFLRYHVAACEVAGYRPREELVYVSHSAPGLQLSRFSLRDDRTMFLFVFHDERLAAPVPSDDHARRETLATVFSKVGWEAPAILREMRRAPELYFDRVSQIRMPTWHRGRTVLLGDAAACVSLLAGEGTGLALAEAYLLAHELGTGDADPGPALQRWETRVRELVARKQRAAAGFAATFAPRTRAGLFIRDLGSRLLGVRWVADLAFGRTLGDEISLPPWKG